VKFFQFFLFLRFAGGENQQVIFYGISNDAGEGEDGDCLGQPQQTCENHVFLEIV